MFNLFKKKELKKLSSKYQEVFNRIMSFDIGDWKSFASYSDSGYINSGYIKTDKGDSEIEIYQRIVGGHNHYLITISNIYIVEFEITHKYGFDYYRLDEYFRDTISFCKGREARKILSAKKEVIDNFLEATK
jgi:hypothetical protein